MHWLEASVE